MTCWFNEILLAKFGPEAGCSPCSVEDCNYGACTGNCQFGPPCEECGHPRVYCNDECAGRPLLCLNPECVKDK